MPAPVNGSVGRLELGGVCIAPSGILLARQWRLMPTVVKSSATKVTATTGVTHERAYRLRATSILYLYCSFISIALDIEPMMVAISSSHQFV